MLPDPTPLEFVDAALNDREPEVITVTMRRRQRRVTMRLSVQAARDLVTHLEYYAWKAGRTGPSSS
jgi:hypothetical protein